MSRAPHYVWSAAVASQGPFTLSSFLGATLAFGLEESYWGHYIMGALLEEFPELNLSSQIGKNGAQSLTLPRNQFLTGFEEGFHLFSPTSSSITTSTAEKPWENPNKWAHTSLLLSLLLDRICSPPSPLSHSSTEAQHWGQGLREDWRKMDTLSISMLPVCPNIRK